MTFIKFSKLFNQLGKIKMIFKAKNEESLISF